MTLQEQLRKLTTGGPGVTHIASETLFEEAAKALDSLENGYEILSWRCEKMQNTLEEISECEEGSLEVENAFAASLCAKARVCLASAFQSLTEQSK